MHVVSSFLRAASATRRVPPSPRDSPLHRPEQLWITACLGRMKSEESHGIAWSVRLKWWLVAPKFPVLKCSKVCMSDMRTFEYGLASSPAPVSPSVELLKSIRTWFNNSTNINKPALNNVNHIGLQVALDSSSLQRFCSPLESRWIKCINQCKCRSSFESFSYVFMPIHEILISYLNEAPASLFPPRWHNYALTAKAWQDLSVQCLELTLPCCGPTTGYTSANGLQVYSLVLQFVYSLIGYYFLFMLFFSKSSAYRFEQKPVTSVLEF